MNKENRISIKQYYCIDCDNKISYQSALYGSHKCRSCVQKGKKCNFKIIKKMKIRMKGKKNINFKHGKTMFPNYCQCGKEINYRSQKCNKCNKCYNKIFIKLNIGRRHTKETKIKQSKAHEGKNNPMYGKITPHGKRIYYRGICMRSSWETAYAKYLDNNNIKWSYESKRFYFKDCTYCPDFYLPEMDKYIEIKGYWREESKKRFKLFRKLYPNENIKVLMKKDFENLRIKI